MVGISKNLKKNRTSFTDIPFHNLYSDIWEKLTKFVINVTPIRKIILYLKTPSLLKSQEGNRLLLIFLIFSGCFGMSDLQHPGKDLRPKKA